MGGANMCQSLAEELTTCSLKNLKWLDLLKISGSAEGSRRAWYQLLWPGPQEIEQRQTERPRAWDDFWKWIWVLPRYTWIYLDTSNSSFSSPEDLRVRWFWAAPRNWWNWWDSHVTYCYNGFAYRGCWWYVFVSKCRIPPNPGRPWYGEVVSTEFVEPNRRRWWLAKVSRSLEGGPVGDRAKVVEPCGQTAGRFTNFLVHFLAKQILLL